MPDLKKLVNNLKNNFEHISYGQGNELLKSLGDLMAQRSDVSGGICFGLSCQWIELHRDYHSMGQGEKYRVECMTKRIKDLAADSVFFYRAMNSQSEYINTSGLTGFESMNETAKKYKLQFEARTKHADSNHLSRSIDRTHFYHLVSFERVENGGHAICVYKSGGKFLGVGSHLYIFDANFGEFRVKGGQIRAFFQAYFDIYGPLNYLNSFRVAFRK